MKQVILLYLLTSLAAGTPVVQRQDAGVDATALGQSWIQKIEDFVKADKNVGAECERPLLRSMEGSRSSAAQPPLKRLARYIEFKKALINNMSKCKLETAPPELNLPNRYTPECPTVFSVIDNGDAVDAATLGQAWIAKAGTAVRENESLQARQQILSSILSCKFKREGGLFPGDPDEFRFSCSPVEGDMPSSSAGIAPVEEKPDGQDREAVSAPKPFLEPASLSESDEICGSLSGSSAVNEKGTSEACVGTELFCRQGFYRMTFEDFANADECLNSRADPDGITFPYY